MGIYKGINISISKDSFGHYDARLIGYRDKGTKRQKYFLESLYTFFSRQEALEEAKKYIDRYKNNNDKWHSSGLSKATYLPD